MLICRSVTGIPGLVWLCALLFVQVGAARAQQQSFGEWGLACQALGPGQTRCALFQRVLRDGNTLVLEAQVLGLETGADQALAITTPLGVWLEAGVTIRIDGGEAVSQSFQTCATRGCIARFEAPELLSQLDAGSEVAITYATGREETQRVSLTLSLIGIREGVAAIRQANQ